MIFLFPCWDIVSSREGNKKMGPNKDFDVEVPRSCVGSFLLPGEWRVGGGITSQGFSVDK